MHQAPHELPQCQSPSCRMRHIERTTIIAGHEVTYVGCECVLRTLFGPYLAVLLQKGAIISAQPLGALAKAPVEAVTTLQSLGDNYLITEEGDTDGDDISN